MNRKNNKGLTLVELLISFAIIGILMTQIAYLIAQTSGLYLKGVNEVSLQTESQHLIQQLEEILIDSNVELGVTFVSQNSISSDDIIIKSYEVVDGVSTNNLITYEIKLNRDPSDLYGSVSMSKTDNALGTPVTTSDIPMADYVQTISYNASKFSTDSVIQINVTMANDDHTYVASKDIYCRNNIGVSGNGVKPANTAKYDYELNMLRYDTIDMRQFLKDREAAEDSVANSAKFEFVDANSDYALNTTTWKLTCSDTLNAAWNSSVGTYIIRAYTSSGAKICDIGVLTDPVGVGVGGAGSTKGYSFGYGSKDSQDLVSIYIPVTGVALHTAKLKSSLYIYAPDELKIGGANKGSDVKAFIKSSADIVSSNHVSTDGKVKNTTENVFSAVEFSVDGHTSKLSADNMHPWTDKLSNSAVLSNAILKTETGEGFDKMLGYGAAVIVRDVYTFPSGKSVEACFVLIPGSYDDSTFSYTYKGVSPEVSYSSYYTYCKKVVKPTTF